MNRRILPQRRRAETFTVIHWNQPFTVTAGFFDDGTIGEVFVNSRKTGGDVEAIARDAAVVISLALQHGTPIETIRRAVTKVTIPAAQGAAQSNSRRDCRSPEPREVRHDAPSWQTRAPRHVPGRPW